MPIVGVKPGRAPITIPATTPSMHIKRLVKVRILANDIMLFNLLYFRNVRIPTGRFVCSRPWKAK